MADGSGMDTKAFDNTATSIGHGGQTLVGLTDEVRISETVHSPVWIRTEFLNQASNGVFMTYGKVVNQRMGTMVMVK